MPFISPQTPYPPASYGSPEERRQLANGFKSGRINLTDPADALRSSAFETASKNARDDHGWKLEAFRQGLIKTPHPAP